MARTKVIVGNWKLHKTIAEAQSLAVEVKNRTSGVAGQGAVEVGIAPVFTALSSVAQRLEGAHVTLYAQNCHHEDAGAFTGEVSVSLLADAGCGGVIVGHSERRQLFGETDEGVGKKTRAVLGAGLQVIVCVGETEQERDRDETFAVVARQLAGAVGQLSPAQAAEVILAYEPVWAIGTGRTATPAQAQEVHAYLRGQLAERFGDDTAQTIRIQYGGSVKPANAAELLGQPDIDGALVGGASLSADSFVDIVKAARA